LLNVFDVHGLVLTIVASLKAICSIIDIIWLIIDFNRFEGSEPSSSLVGDLSFFEKSLEVLILHVSEATRLEVNPPQLLIDKAIKRLASVGKDCLNDFRSEVAR
jgi:hypothetical protein